jgi:N-acetylmuramoyl-L-alanine amidase
MNIITRTTFLILFLLCSLPALATAAEVKAMRIWAAPQYTRAVIDVSANVEYEVFTLQNPDRLVLDIRNGKARHDFRADGRGLVSGVRSGTPDRGKFRIVMDLNAAVRPKSFLLPPADRFGHRLVLDLYPATASVATPPRRVEEVSRRAGQRNVVIAIDAGHGGEDPGAIGPAGTYEKHITLKVSRLLAEKINAEPGMTAVLIRDGDYFVPLRDRFEKAREQKADLFVSIHADAAYNARARGSSVYILGQRAASNEAARYLAERENRSDLVGGVKLDDKDDTLAAVLLDLSQGATLEASSQVAEHVLSSLQRFGKAHKRHVERANFAVLRSPDVPSLLVETAFISNPEEERKLNDPAHRARVASAILEGVRNFFHSAPPPGTWIAANARASKHVVSPGETLGDIARRHQVSVSSLRQANALNSDLVQAGAVLTIPQVGR